MNLKACFSSFITRIFFICLQSCERDVKDYIGFIMGGVVIPNNPNKPKCPPCVLKAVFSPVRTVFSNFWIKHHPPLFFTSKIWVHPLLFCTWIIWNWLSLNSILFIKSLYIGISCFKLIESSWWNIQGILHKHKRMDL